MCMCIKYIKNSNYNNLFFIFLFYNTLTAILDGKAWPKKATFSQLEGFLDKTTLNFHSVNKINNFV